MSKLLNILSLESKGPKQNVETEAVIFAKVMNPEGLGEAIYKEHHEQLEADMGAKGRCRVRKVTTDEDVKYEFVIKTPNGQAGAGLKSSIESTAVLVDEVFFETFRKVAKKMLRKTRFVFDGKVTSGGIGYSRSAPPPGVKYEVDIFETQQGKMSEWCKIDVELDKLLEFLESPQTITNDDRQVKLTFKVSHLPFKPSEAFISSQATPEQKTLLDELWDKQFNLPPDWTPPQQTSMEHATLTGDELYKEICRIWNSFVEPVRK